MFSYAFTSLLVGGPTVAEIGKSIAASVFQVIVFESWSFKSFVEVP
jgi:hypothetical protein